MPFQIRSMGIYMVVDTTVGLILMWDKKTSIFIKLSPSFQVYFKSENKNKINSVTYSYVHIHVFLKERGWKFRL